MFSFSGNDWLENAEIYGDWPQNGALLVMVRDMPKLFRTCALSCLFKSCIYIF